MPFGPESLGPESLGPESLGPAASGPNTSAKETCDSNALSHAGQAVHQGDTAAPSPPPAASTARELLEQALSDRRNGAVRIVPPQHAGDNQLVDMAQSNAREEARRQEQKNELGILDRLARSLHLAGPPHRIECVDVSHTGGQQTRVGLVVFEEGQPARSQYRAYAMPDSGDDYATLYAWVARRLESGPPWPDLLLIDGGRGQLSSVQRAPREAGKEDLFALAAIAKAGGLAILGAPRTPAAAKAEAPPRAALLAPLFLAAGLVAAAALAPALLRFVGQAVLAFPGMDPAPARAALEQAAMAARTVGFFGAGIIALAAGLLWLRARAGAAHGRRREPTWGCGYTAPTAHMQYGAASFVEPTTKLLAGPMGVARRLDMDPGLFPKRATLFVVSRDAARDKLFTPLFEAVARLCDAAKVVQHGKVHLYILYVLATVVLLLAWKLS